MDQRVAKQSGWWVRLTLISGLFDPGTSSTDPLHSRSLAAYDPRHGVQEAIDRVIPAMRDAWKGEIPLSPMVPSAPANDLFR